MLEELGELQGYLQTHMQRFYDLQFNFGPYAIAVLPAKVRVVQEDACGGESSFIARPGVGGWTCHRSGWKPIKKTGRDRAGGFLYDRVKKGEGRGWLHSQNPTSSLVGQIPHRILVGGILCDSVHVACSSG